MASYYDTEVERQKKGDLTANTVLPILAAIETIATAKASRGQNVGTNSLQLYKDTQTSRQNALERAVRMDEQAADRTRQNTLFGYQKDAAERAKKDAAQAEKDRTEKDTQKKAAIARLLGVPEEVDPVSGAVTKPAVPEVEGLTDLDREAIKQDPFSWIAAKLKPVPTQLVFGEDGTLQTALKTTGKTPEGKTIKAPPKPKEKSLEEIAAEAAARAAGAASGNPKADKPTEDQSKSAVFARRMELAMDDLDEVGKLGYDPTTAENAARSSSLAPNFANTKEGQRYKNAKKNFVMANLRKESGAVIGDKELQDQYDLYFPVYGDLPETVEQKARLRAQAFEGMKANAGKQFDAIPSMIPKKDDPATAANAVIEELKKRARAGDAKAQAGLKAKGIAF